MTAPTPEARAVVVPDLIEARRFIDALLGHLSAGAASIHFVGPLEQNVANVRAWLDHVDLATRVYEGAGAYGDRVRAHVLVALTGVMGERADAQLAPEDHSMVEIVAGRIKQLTTAAPAPVPVVLSDAQCLALYEACVQRALSATGRLVTRRVFEHDAIAFMRAALAVAVAE